MNAESYIKELEKQLDDVRDKCEHRGRTIAGLEQQIRAHKEGTETGRQLIWYQQQQKVLNAALDRWISRALKAEAELATRK